MTKREGIPMTEESLKEWQKAFLDIEESIEALYSEKEKRNRKYMKLKQQNLFD